MNPVSKTAYYTLGLRVWDAEQPEPIIGDRYAELFMTDEGREIAELFRPFPRPNSSNVGRHRIIDDLLRDELVRDLDTRVVLVGAGFDSRAFRLAGGNWVEVDEPAVIALKEERLPAEQCPNELVRVPVSFGSERLEDKLAPFATPERVLVAIEGVLMYLTNGERDALLEALTTVFPRQTLVCDLMTRTFFDKYTGPIHETIESLGARFTDLSDTPEAVFVRHGYVATRRISVVGRGIEVGAVRMPRVVLNWFLKPLRDGYSIWSFEYGGN